MGSLDYMRYDELFSGLEKLDMLESSPTRRDIRPTEKLRLLLSSMNISLTQLSTFSSKSVVCSPAFQVHRKLEVEPDVFVVMPFLDEMQPIYSDHITKVVRQLEVTIARGDDFFTAGSIVSEIWQAISAAKVILADCTGRNPNVFYEMGIAHTLGKPVILTAQSKDDIPFDIQHIRTILYQFTPRGMQEYEKKLKATLETELIRPRLLKDCLKTNS